jgi:signal transduction histidine kinase
VGGFGRAKLILTSGAVVLSAAVAWVGLDGQRSSPGEVALTLVTGWSFVASGLVAWRMCGSPGCRSGRWPTNLIGPVMVVTGLLRLAPGLESAQNPVLFTIGDALEPAYVVGVVYLVLAFPEGRLAGTLERLLVGAAFVAVLPLTVTWLALGGTHGPCNDCRESLLVIADVPDVYTPLHNVTLGGGAVVAVVSIGVLGRRWHLATPRLRFAIAPVLWVGAAVFVVIGVWLSEMVIRDDHRAISDALFGITLAFVPIAFLVGVARTRLARSAVADLVIELGSTPPPGELLEALARALRDPSLKVAYWLPDTERYVDALGRTVSLPKATTERGVTMVEHGGRRVAALIHDPALHQDQRLVQSVCAAAGLALENGRLQAELQARLADLAASRSRIVEAEETERRRIERDLHDGTQQRLVSVAMTLGLAESRAANDPGGTQTLLREARTGLADALSELREISQGIHPSILTERGLRGALDELASRAGLPVHLDVTLTRRLSEYVEATGYYVVSEALTNIAKHARATSASVAVTDTAGGFAVVVTDDGVGGAQEHHGSGLKGLRDRVEAIGGRLTVHSPPGRGTTLRVELPCES